MVAFQVTIDDVNPLIQYSPGLWNVGGPTDTSYQQYFLSTFTTDTQLGTVSFSFRGTSVGIYGAKRGNHGTYTVNIDGKISTGNGFASPDQFQQPLFSQSGLVNTQHTVVLTNTQNGSFVDIDFITYDIEVAPNLVFLTEQDDSPAFNYTGSWSQNPVNVGSFSGGTGHTTSTTGDSVTYTFRVSSAVQIYGTVGPNNEVYTVALDGGAPSSFNSSTLYPFVQVMLYEANNLVEGTHSLKLTNQPVTAGKRLDIDFATVRQAPSSSNSSGSPNGISASSNGSGSSLSTGAIAGIAVCGCVIVGLVLAILYLIRRLKSSSTKPINIDSPTALAYQIDPLPLPGSNHHAPSQVTQRLTEASPSVPSGYNPNIWQGGIIGTDSRTQTHESSTAGSRSTGKHRQVASNSSNAQSIVTTNLQPMLMESRTQVGGPAPSVMSDLPPDYNQSAEQALLQGRL